MYNTWSTKINSSSTRDLPVIHFDGTEVARVMATVVKKVKRAGKRASKYQFTANFQSIVVECIKEKW